MIRSLKRSATKTFNYVISVQHSTNYQLYHQVITSFDELCKAVKKLPSTIILRPLVVVSAGRRRHAGELAKLRWQHCSRNDTGYKKTSSSGRGTSQGALILFAPQATALVRNVSAVNASSKVLSLPRAADCRSPPAVERRVPDWTQSTTQKRDTKRQRVSSSSKNDVIFARKVAQSLVKCCSQELDGIVAVMDLACVALYVVCILEPAVRLGDLVVGNPLYQVAKKYAEIPELSRLI
ncbi:hypothetical protein GN958_ATG16517 [Phytophthora infestans]|uniref:Uncharacterized protein n=1 Tax=Phytophthora infestans TaxID=4787 RepID=A0A8S9U538_PHYIN|nr:hypothetical protein GN958_ATG16517 [Phytophthora infestans]